MGIDRTGDAELGWAAWATLEQPSADDGADHQEVPTGSPWRDLPVEFGTWPSVAERHLRWSTDGTYARLFGVVRADQGDIDQVDLGGADLERSSRSIRPLCALSARGRRQTGGSYRG